MLQHFSLEGLVLIIDYIEGNLVGNQEVISVNDLAKQDSCGLRKVQKELQLADFEVVESVTLLTFENSHE